MHAGSEQVRATAAGCNDWVVFAVIIIATTWGAMPAAAQGLPQQTLAAGEAAMAPRHPGEVDLDGSRIYVFVGKTGLGHDHAVIGRLQAGRISLDTAEQAGKLVFDVRTFIADTADARKVLGLAGETDADTRKQVTVNMLGPDVLDAARHPLAAFEINSALRSPRNSPAGNPLYDLSGVFTLKGVARQVVVPVEVEQAGGLLRLKGGFSILQTDFGMTPYRKFGGVVGVADELRIFGDIRLHGSPVPVGSAPAVPTGVGLP